MPKMTNLIPLILMVLFSIWLGRVSARADATVSLQPIVGKKPTTVGHKPTSGDIDIPRLIRAIKAVENWDGHSVGAKGELGPMQMRKATWKQFCKVGAYELSHAWATSLEPETKEVERAYAEWMVRTSADFWFDPRAEDLVYHCALIHTAGYGNVMKGRVGKAKREFAERVCNVYNDDGK